MSPLDLNIIENNPTNHNNNNNNKYQIEQQLPNFLLQFFKYYFLTFVQFTYGYLICYYGLTFDWIYLFALMFTIIQLENSRILLIKFLISKCSNQQIQYLLKCLAMEKRNPQSCSSTDNDKESVQWLNKALVQAWPFMIDYLKQLIRDTILQKFVDQFDVTLVEINVGENVNILFIYITLQYG